MPPKKTKKNQNKEEKEEEEQMTVLDYVIIFTSILMFVVLMFLLYLLYLIINQAQLKKDNTKVMINKIERMYKNVFETNMDSQNIETINEIITFLDNQTLSDIIYENMKNNSFFELFTNGISVRSEMCNDKLHRKTVNKISELLLKYLTNNDYSFDCNSFFISNYLPRCYSFHISNDKSKFKHIFTLIDTLISKGKCNIEIADNLIKAGKITRDPKLLIDIFPYLEKAIHQSEKQDNGNTLICKHAETTSDYLDKLNVNQQATFCKEIENYQCSLLEDEYVKEKCNINKSTDL